MAGIFTKRIWQPYTRVRVIFTKSPNILLSNTVSLHTETLVFLLQ